MFVPIKGDGIISGAQSKFQRFLVYDDPLPELKYQYPEYSDFELYINRIASNRYYLSKTYAIHFIFNTPLSEQLIGGNNTIEGGYRDSVPVRNGMASHNTYLDMLFMMGIIGTALVLIFVMINLIRYYISYLKTKDIRMLCLVFVMLTVLLFSLSISTFPFRYSIAFLLI